MDKKKISIENKVEEEISTIADRFLSIIGRVFYVGSFGIEVGDTGSISVVDNYGTTITYAPMTDSWIIITEFLLNFDESSKDTLVRFFEYVAFPVVRSMPIADKSYFESVVSAYEKVSSEKLGSTNNADPEIVNLARVMFENKIQLLKK